MKLSTDIKWWKLLALPSLAAMGCGKGVPDTKERYVDSPETTISKMNHYASAGETLYWRTNSNGGLQSMRFTKETAEKYREIDSLLPDSTKSLLRTMRIANEDLASTFQIKVIDAIEDNSLSSKEGAKVVMHAAYSYSSLTEAAFKTVSTGISGYSELESKKWSKALPFFTLPDGTIQCHVRFPANEEIKLVIEKSDLLIGPLDFGKISDQNPNISDEIRSAAMAVLFDSVQARNYLKEFGEKNTRFKEKISSLLSDDSDTPKLSYAVSIIQYSLDFRKRGDVSIGNELIDFGLKFINQENDLERVYGLDQIYSFLNELDFHLYIRKPVIFSLLRELCTLPSQHFDKLHPATYAFREEADNWVTTKQECFNTNVMPLIIAVRENKTPSAPQIAKLLRDLLKPAIMPHDYWPENVQILASDGISYCDWDRVEKVLNKIGEDVLLPREKDESKVPTIVGKFKAENSNILTAREDISNNGPVVSDDFEDFSLFQNINKTQPLRVLLIVGRDFRTDRNVDHEGFMEMLDSLALSMKSSKHITDVDIHFAPSKRGFNELISGIGRFGLKDNGPGLVLNGEEKREDLLLVFAGLGYTGPKLNDEKNVGLMFDGSVILDQRSTLEEYELKRKLQEISPRFRKITLLMLTDSAAAFLK